MHNICIYIYINTTVLYIYIYTDNIYIYIYYDYLYTKDNATLDIIFIVTNHYTSIEYNPNIFPTLPQMFPIPASKFSFLKLAPSKCRTDQTAVAEHGRLA